jgi:hypothetical protein
MAMSVTVAEIPVSQMPCSICLVRPARVKTTTDGLDKHTERLPCETCEQLWPYFETRLQPEDYSPPQ